MSFHEIWGYVREKFPPARAVAVLTTALLPLIGYLNVWIADHAPWVDQYVHQDQRMGIFIGTIVAGVALAYKWLDGRAKWESKQIEAYVALAQAGKLDAETETALREHLLTTPPRRRRRAERHEAETRSMHR